MVPFFGLPTASTATVVVVHIYASTSAATGDPSPDNRYATPRAEQRALLRLERRVQYRDFVGHPPASRAGMNRDSRRARTAARRRREQQPWRTRALGKRPSPTASG
jgi:hypothetical protein